MTPADACYVYGIVPADVEVDEGLRGVGDPAGEVRVVRHDTVAALVSPVRSSRPLGTPDDLMTHQRLLDTAAAGTPVLPLRFGAVVSDPDAVVDELLAPHTEEFSDALRELEDRAEFVVKARYVENAVLREVLTENPEAARLASDIRATGDTDATRGQRIRLGELISEAVAAKRDADTRTVVAALAACGEDTRAREPAHEEDAANVAVLVAAEREDELRQAVTRLTRDWEGRVAVRLLGPMAPYDFVVARAPEEA